MKKEGELNEKKTRAHKITELMLYIGAFCTHKNKIETLWKTLRLHFHLFFFHWSWQARIQMYLYQYDSQTTKMQQTDVNEMGINANRQYFLLVFVFF